MSRTAVSRKSGVNRPATPAARRRTPRSKCAPSRGRRGWRGTTGTVTAGSGRGRGAVARWAESPAARDGPDSRFSRGIRWHSRRSTGRRANQPRPGLPAANPSSLPDGSRPAAGTPPRFRRSGEAPGVGRVTTMESGMDSARPAPRGPVPGIPAEPLSAGFPPPSLPSPVPPVSGCRPAPRFARPPAPRPDLPLRRVRVPAAGRRARRRNPEGEPSPGVVRGSAFRLGAATVRRATRPSARPPSEVLSKVPPEESAGPLCGGVSPVVAARLRAPGAA